MCYIQCRGLQLAPLHKLEKEPLQLDKLKEVPPLAIESEEVTLSSLQVPELGKQSLADFSPTHTFGGPLGTGHKCLHM